jgi:hypothetical protein
LRLCGCRQFDQFASAIRQYLFDNDKRDASCGADGAFSTTSRQADFARSRRRSATIAHLLTRAT